MDQSKSVSRRKVLAAGGSALLLPSMSLAQRKPNRKRVLRIAHLTDIHVQPERGAPEGMETALAHVKAQKDKVDFVFTGGDLIMDAMGATRERSKEQWDIFTRVIAESKIPVEHTIGNHDVWGWNNRGKYSQEPGFGKEWTCEILGLEKPYRSFDRSGWHFIVLDSTFPKEGGGYTAKIDDEQFEWLKADLAKVLKATPILVISHIPILAACAFFDGDNEKSGNWAVPGAWMHIDARKIKDLFLKHPNVKMCVSGHIHLIDQVVYNGVNYFCNGAVSGGWWGGNYQECTYGYALINLYNDGTFENEYVPYGWKTK
jgi:3',5'-cyclic-AMP phosphodiesterase